MGWIGKFEPFASKITRMFSVCFYLVIVYTYARLFFIELIFEHANLIGQCLQFVVKCRMLIFDLWGLFFLLLIALNYTFTVAAWFVFVLSLIVLLSDHFLSSLLIKVASHEVSIGVQVIVEVDDLFNWYVTRPSFYSI